MNRLIDTAARTAALAMVSVGFMTASALAAPCAPGTAAHEYADWQWIENNAARTADAYAAEHFPQATYFFKTSEVIYREGTGYLVELTSKGKTGNISTATLEPNFDFCSDPSGLDDGREDLLTVLGGTFNGQPF
ncbi:hypothetical protein TH9_22465 [Thalassospira xiamenensis]|uniref:hypothetical protein n=1 Tax=Thalassospira xiamenensis TaxID=220697 RepID=UPI000DFF229E|nr:hypothetical protein [Thalassospira xiamenensis]RCK27572.1 hypothetical protein TH9_22465 [Thalassospira xiamenensis]